MDYDIDHLLATQHFDCLLNLNSEFVLLEGSSKQFMPFKAPMHLPVSIASFCIQGDAYVSYDLKSYHFKKNDLSILLPDHLTTLNDVSDDFRCFCYIISNEFAVNSIYQNTMNMRLNIRNNPLFSLDDEDAALMMHTHELMRAVLSRPNVTDRKQMVHYLFNVVFSLIHSVNTNTTSDAPAALKLSHREDLFDRFYELVVNHHHESRNVIWYAQKMNITPKYFSSLIKQITGKTANQWIDELVILEAKSVLINEKKKTIQMVGDELGFPDQSFFSRYFKKHTGMSPHEYRIGKGK